MELAAPPEGHEWGISPERVVLAGFSMGGTLAAWTALQARQHRVKELVLRLQNCKIHRKKKPSRPSRILFGQISLFFSVCPCSPGCVPVSVSVCVCVCWCWCLVGSEGARSILVAK